MSTTGCNDRGTKANQPFDDAGRTATENDAPAQIITMPDGFSNLASKCDGPNRIYSAFHGDNHYGALAVVKDDPRCTSGGK